MTFHINWDRQQQYNGQVEHAIRWRCLPEIAQLRKATLEEDTQEATDYVLLLEEIGTIGCRIRRDRCRCCAARKGKECRWDFVGCDLDWLPAYRDLTFRLSGFHSEFDKVKAGMPRWYMLAFVRPIGVGAWFFIDMERLRDCGILNGLEKRRCRRKDKPFTWVRVAELRQMGAVVASYEVATEGARA